VKRSAAPAIALAVVAASCGSSASPSNPSNPTTTPRPSGRFALTASPLDPAVVEFIAPLGNLNPPGHTLPTDHIYFYYRLLNPSAPARVVFAPADGTVQSAINGNDGEAKLPFANPARYSSESLHVDSPIKYFDEPVRSQLYALVRRASGDRDGTFIRVEHQPADRPDADFTTSARVYVR